MIQPLAPGRISVVVPAKDNQQGVERFLGHFFDRLPNCDLPLEIIIVDDGSLDYLYVPAEFYTRGPRITIAHSPVTRNRAGARNLGLKLARGDWILFVDSDCIPGPSLISGYQRADDGQSVAYAGATYSLDRDPLSRFYDQCRVFVPPPVADRRPLYLITANAVVNRDVLVQMNGFDEILSSGEDLDLSFRILSRYSIGYALDSVVRHDMSDGFIGFVERFYRYGRGSRLLEAKYDGNRGQPQGWAFRPSLRPSEAWGGSFNRLMLVVRYLCELWGYRRCAIRELHADLDAGCVDRVEEEGAAFLLSSLADELETLLNRGGQAYRDMPLRQLYGFSTLLLFLLGQVHPHLETALAARFLGLQPHLRR